MFISDLRTKPLGELSRSCANIPLETSLRIPDRHLSMNFILGTAGHIDHGKSSLVQALTGINPDRLPEEQKRGVTIELGFAHLSLTGPEGQDLQVGVVDVPGHADFVNNMVAGVGALDLALIVVAADDGWMPQSEEHLHILSYLGMTRAIIALTKIDIAEDPEFSLEFVRDSLAGSAFEDSPIHPVSSHTGEGMDELRSAIAKALSESPPAKTSPCPAFQWTAPFRSKGWAPSSPAHSRAALFPPARKFSSNRRDFRCMSVPFRIIAKASRPPARECGPR